MPEGFGKVDFTAILHTIQDELAYADDVSNAQDSYVSSLEMLVGAIREVQEARDYLKHCQKS